MRTYQLMHRRVNGTKDQYTITMPAPLARMIIQAGITSFTVSLTEDGVLYRPVTPDVEPTTLPAWLKKEGA